MSTTPLTNPTTIASICGVFLVITAPLYLLFRYYVKVVRQAYGFDPPPEDGLPLRICGQCHNTVMEDDFTHCPYCGARLVARSSGATAVDPGTDSAPDSGAPGP